MNENTKTTKLAPLKFRQIIAYGTGDLGFALIIHMTGLFLLYFWTDIFGISAAAAGSIFLIAKIWDAINDPIMGYLSDRTRTRWGRYKPYLLFGTVPLVIFNILLWVTPNFGATGKYIYALAIYICWGMAYTATNLPYGSMAAVFTQDPKERTSLAAARMFFGMPGIVIISVVTPIIVSIFSSEKTGYPIAVIIYSVIAAVLLFSVFFSVKERIKPNTKDSYSLKEMISLIKNNTPLLLLSAAVFLVGIGNGIRLMMALYYFEYNIGQPSLFTVFVVINVGMMMVGALLSVVLGKKMSKSNLYNLGIILFVIGDLGIFFSPYSSIAMIMLFSAISGLGGGMAYTLVWALVADTVEYGEWKSGKRAEGVTYSTYSFFGKLAGAVGAAFGGFVLDASGYIPHAAQTVAVENTIRGLFSLTPVITGIIALIVMRFYKLDNKFFQKILTDLEVRRGNA